MPLCTGYEFLKAWFIYTVGVVGVFREEAKEKMTAMKKTGSHALAAWEEQMNDVS